MTPCLFVTHCKKALYKKFIMQCWFIYEDLNQDLELVYHELNHRSKTTKSLSGFSTLSFLLKSVAAIRVWFL